MTYRAQLEAHDIIHVRTDRKADVRFTDGALSHTLGVVNVQVVRTCQDPELAPEGLGWTYAHASMITTWQGEYLIQYLANPRSEHEGHGRAFLVRSKDGIHWNKPVEIFPQIDVPSAPYRGKGREFLKSETTNAVIHHRMSFYHAKNGKMLAVTQYGVAPLDPQFGPLPPKGSVHSYDMVDNLAAPCMGFGVGRVVREIRPDFSFGPIYFVRYDSSGGYTKDNVHVFPFYQEADDPALREACDDLLGNKLATAQWWEEERNDQSGFFTIPHGQAPCIYTLPDSPDEKVVVMKKSLVARSHDGGQTWEPAVEDVSLETSTGKVWGQRTPDGRYALVYNPTLDSTHRWPLSVTTGEDGLNFEGLSTLLPIVSPERYAGRLKNMGPQYIRGICEYNPQPVEKAFYVTYSNNKEDIWLSRVAVPVRTREEKDVDEVMEDLTWSEIASSWNLTIPSWGGIDLTGGALRMRDSDPYMVAICERSFVPAAKLEAECTVSLDQSEGDQCLTIAFQDDQGREPVKLLLRPDGWANARMFGSEVHIGRFTLGRPVTCRFLLDAVKNTVKVTLQSGKGEAEKSWRFDNSVWNLSRVQFRTKYRLYTQNEEDYPKWGDLGNLEGADTPTKEIKASIHAVKIRTVERA